MNRTLLARPSTQLVVSLCVAEDLGEEVENAAV
jgi:hypothetical protein